MNMNLFKFFYKRNRYNARKESFNIVESIAKCKTLYKEMIREAHPDKHLEKKALAEELSQLINKYRHNYAELIKLKSRLEKELL